MVNNIVMLSRRRNIPLGNGFFAALRMTGRRAVWAALPANKVFKVIKVLNDLKDNKDLKVFCGQSRHVIEQN